MAPRQISLDENVANPIGAIASVAMLLEHGLGLAEEARAVEAAIEATLASGVRTQDIAVQAKAATTTEAAAAIRDRVLAERGVALLDRHALGEVPGLVDVASAADGDVVGEQLQRHGHQHRRDERM